MTIITWLQVSRNNTYHHVTLYFSLCDLVLIIIWLCTYQHVTLHLLCDLVLYQHAYVTLYLSSTYHHLTWYLLSRDWISIIRCQYSYHHMTVGLVSFTWRDSHNYHSVVVCHKSTSNLIALREFAAILITVCRLWFPSHFITSSIW